MSAPEALAHELDSYAALEVAALSGALQLLPANAHHADRLVALAATALERDANGTSPVTRAELTRWLVESPSLHTGPPWDAYEGPFCEPINFVGGGYLMLTGGEPEAVFHVRTLLNAMLGSRMPLLRAGFDRDALQLARGVLALSTYACQTAGTPRWASADSGDSVAVPGAGELDRLRAAVTFTGTELARVAGVDVLALTPIMRDLEVDGAPAHVPEDTQFTAKPLLRRGDSYALVEPGALATALRHALISLAVAHGLKSQLVGWLGHTALGQVAAAMDRMGWRGQERVPASDAPLVSVLAEFDTDKVANVVILYEDLEGYDPADPLTTWDARKWEASLTQHLRVIEDGVMFGLAPRPNELLHVVVLAGCGRPSMFGLPAPAEPLEAPHLLMSVENLDRISMGEHDPLTLWNYARASERVRRDCHVVAFGPLDEFAAWSEDQSYYTGDDGKPTMLMFDGSWGRALREKVARSRDVHGVVAPHGNWIEVVRLHDEEQIPIYASLHDLGGRPMLLVEGAALPLWVRAPEHYADPEHRIPHMQIVDCIAYWLWQLTPSLGFVEAATTEPRFIVEVVVDEPEAWVQNSVPESPGEVAAATRAGDGLLRLSVSSTLMRELNRPDNQGERALIRALLQGLDDMVDADLRLGAEGIDKALESHAPLGPKKKINLLSTDADPALVPGELPPYRPISPADNDELFDAAGERIASKFSLDCGPIEGDTRIDVLNDIVGFHFAELRREVAKLSPGRAPRIPRCAT